MLPGAVIVGGGLASIDVAKVHTLELTVRELAKRGIKTNVVELEVKGIPKILAGHGLTFEDLGIVPPTIYYRRRVEDMPLMTPPDGADAARIAKVEAGRKRMLEKSTEKYCFKVEPLSAPEALLVENGRLVGLRFRRDEDGEREARMTDERFEVRGPVVLSSIGSIPEPIEGIATKGELFDFKDWEIGRLQGYPTVFSVGNVVTGKGNIVASRKHARHVGQHVRDEYLKLVDGVAALPPLSGAQRESLLQRVRARQAKVGFRGYAEWIKAARPPEFI